MEKFVNDNLKNKKYSDIFAILQVNEDVFRMIGEESLSIYEQHKLKLNIKKYNDSRNMLNNLIEDNKGEDINDKDQLFQIYEFLRSMARAIDDVTTIQFEVWTWTVLPDGSLIRRERSRRVFGNRGGSN